MNEQEERAFAQLTDADRKIAEVDSAFWREDALKRLDGASGYAQAVWKSLMLMNGGAIVALFTLIGNSGAAVERYWLWWAFGSFVLGLASTLGSNATGFVCQSYYMHQSTKRAWNAQEIMHSRKPVFDEKKPGVLGELWEIVSIVLAVCALLLFIVGSGFALAALKPGEQVERVPALASPSDPHKTRLAPKDLGQHGQRKTGTPPQTRTGGNEREPGSLPR